MTRGGTEPSEDSERRRGSWAGMPAVPSVPGGARQCPAVPGPLCAHRQPAPARARQTARGYQAAPTAWKHAEILWAVFSDHKQS